MDDPSARKTDLVPTTTTSSPAGRLEAGSIRRTLTSIGGGAARLLGQGREGIQDGLQAAGASIEHMHRRLALVLLALSIVLVMGAGCRALGWPQGNYLLIGLLSAAALYAVISPVHLIGVVLAGGGMTAWKGEAEARAGLMAYARVLGVVLLASLTPLVVFAVAPGATDFWTSLRLLLLTPIVVLALWLFGKVAPRALSFVFIAAPLLAATLALGNMLVPERVLAAAGVPAWLRAARPQDDELARIETALERRRNEQRAAELRVVRQKIESGAPLTVEDEALIVAAQQDRMTLTGWVGARYDAVLAEVRRRAATPGGTSKPMVVPTIAAIVVAPRGDWSPPVIVPVGLKLCSQSEAGEAAYTTQCAVGDSEWHRRSAGGCEAGKYDRARFLGRGAPRTIRYSLVPVAVACAP